MKNLSLILNGVLAIAIIVLFVQINSLKHQINPSAENSSSSSDSENSVKPSVTASSTSLADAKIAYVNTDSINEKYNFISDYTKVLKNKKTSLEGQLQSMSAKFQQDYEAFQQSAQAGIAPQAELQKQQLALERQQQELANKEMQLQNLAVEMDEKNIELNKTVKEFLNRFNDGKFDYIISYSALDPGVLLASPKLDITSQVLQGLNDEYKNKKKK